MVLYSPEQHIYCAFLAQHWFRSYQLAVVHIHNRQIGTTAIFLCNEAPMLWPLFYEQLTVHDSADGDFITALDFVVAIGCEK